MKKCICVLFLAFCVIALSSTPALAAESEADTYATFLKNMEDYEEYEKIINQSIEEIKEEGDLYYGSSEDFMQRISQLNSEKSTLEQKIAALAYDTSYSALAQKARLQAELNEVNAEIDELYAKKSRANQITALENELEFYYTQKFGRCSDTDYEHWMGIWKTISDASCENDGERHYCCLSCDFYAYEITPASGHSFSEYLSDGNATCTEDGTKTAVCLECDASDTIVDPGTMLGHKWGEWIEIIAPTLDTEGQAIRRCENCDEAEYNAIPVLVNPFVDVQEDKYYVTPVLWASRNNITNGIDATHFAPDATCNRGQVVTFLWRAAGSPEPTSTNNPFTDVVDGKFYYKAVLWAVERGITNGTSATTFSPNDNCTRGHVATFLWRALGEPDTAANANPFTDVAEGKFYYNAVLWAVEAGVTNGMTPTTFAPGKACSRGQIVTFLYRALTVE